MFTMPILGDKCSSPKKASRAKNFKFEKFILNQILVLFQGSYETRF